jgi:hypothetical protein
MSPPKGAARPTIRQGAPKLSGDGGVLWPGLDLSRTRCKSARLQRLSSHMDPRRSMRNRVPFGAAGWPSERRRGRTP